MTAIQKILLQEQYNTIDPPFKTARTTLSQKRTLFVELISESGKTIQSECVAGDWPGYTEETVETVKATLENTLIPNIIEREFEHPSEVDGWLKELTPDQPMARSVIEMGAWALAAQEEGVSLDQYLGGTQTMIPMGKTLGLQDSLNDLVSAAKSAYHDGYQRLKLKVTPDNVLVVLEVLHKKVKNLLPLVLDGNGTFSHQDLSIFKQVDRFNPLMWEQPLLKEQWKECADIQRQIYTPICLDESLQSVEDVKKMIKMKAAKIVTIKPGCLGGFTESLKVEALCRQHHIPAWVGGMLETPVGKRFLSAFATLPGITMPSDLESRIIEE